MIFAPQNATVIEFGLQPHIDRSYGYMAMALGLDYWVLPQISTHLYLRYKVDSGSVAAAVRLVRHVLETKGILSSPKPTKSVKAPKSKPTDDNVTVTTLNVNDYFDLVM